MVGLGYILLSIVLAFFLIPLIFMAIEYTRQQWKVVTVSLILLGLTFLGSYLVSTG